MAALLCIRFLLNVDKFIRHSSNFYAYFNKFVTHFETFLALFRITIKQEKRGYYYVKKDSSKPSGFK